MTSKEQTLQAIKDTAYTLFAQFGIDKTSFAMIAKEIGVSKPALYYYFDSKEALVTAIFDELYVAIEKDLTIDLRSVTTANYVTSLIAFGDKQIDDQLQNPLFNRVFNEYLLLAARDVRYHERLQAIQRIYLHTFQQYVDTGVTLKQMSAENASHKATILAMVLDNISNYILTGYELDYKKIWAVTVQQVLCSE